MKDRLIISDLEESDIEDVKALETAGDLSAWSGESYQKLFKNIDSACLKAEYSQDRSDRIIGFAVSQMMIASAGNGNSDKENSAEIYNICVAKSYRKRGVGSALIEALFQRYRESRIGAVWLEVRESNRHAVSFYQSRGFKISHARRNYYSKPSESALVMAVKLLP